MRLTASGLGLARKCSWWARPEVVVPSLEASRAATVGTELHAVAETEVEGDVASVDLDEEAIDQGFRVMTHVSQYFHAADGGHLEVSAKIAQSDLEWKEFGAVAPSLRPAEQKVLSRLVDAWREWWDITINGGFGVGGVSDAGIRFSGQEVEVPYAIDLATGLARQLPTKGQRDYSAATSTELCGTADLVLVYTVGDLQVIDYKTGRGPHRYVDHEEQMRFLGAAVALECGHSEVTVSVVHVTPDGCKVDSRLLTAFDIAIIVAELRTLVGRIRDSVALPGLHCDEGYCKAISLCPATRALLHTAEMAIDQRKHLPVSRAPRTNDEAYASMIAIDLLEGWIKARKAAIQVYAENSPIEAPDGRTYGPHPIKRETPRLDVKGAAEKLDEMGLRNAILVRTSTSWEAIKDVIRERQKKIKARVKAGEIEKTERVILAHEEEKVRVALKGIGAIKVSEFTKYEWRKPRTVAAEK